MVISGVHPQAPEVSAEAILAEARSAIADQRYDRAVELLEDGHRHYPLATEFPMFLGDLYYDRELFELALVKYQQAESIDSESYTIREALAYTHGRMSNDHASIAYWGSLAEDFPERPQPVQHLGWLYFKVHRLDEGVQLVTDALERFGPDPDLTMTLGTLYADMYRFSDSQEHYQKAIKLASSTGDDNFVAVAYYNLSLIQKAFYRFSDSLESTNASLSHTRRSTGYLARGELYELRLDYQRAAADYTTAYNLDQTTPLSRMNLAVLHQRFGRLDEALAYATSVLDDPDLAWLYNFGTDTNRHRMDTHEIMADCFQALRKTSRLTAAVGVGGHLIRAWSRVKYRVQEWYHRSRYRRLAGEVADAYLEQGSVLDGTWTFYQAVERNRPVARGYLLQAADLEGAVIPESRLAYEIDIGRLDGDLDRLLATLPQLLDPWDAHLRELALRSVAELTRGRSKRDLYVSATRDLYQLNPGGLRQYGLTFPVRLALTGIPDDSAARRTARRTARYLRGAGFEPTDREDAPVLEVSFLDGSMTAALDPGPGGQESAVLIDAFSRRDIARAINALADELFQAQ